MDGRVALVTGGGSGIGRAASLALAAEGARVVISDIAAGGGEETAAMVRELGGESLFVRTDVTSATQVEAMVARAVDEYGRLDCAFNNAGVQLEIQRGANTLSADCTEEVFDRTLSVNLKGVWLCMKYEVPRMLQAGGGSIVNTSSAAGLVGIEGQAVYVASKHGVIGLTKSSALEYAGSGIRINAVCPGSTRTPMIDDITGHDPDMESKIASGQPLGRMGAPEEIAAAVVWLCSDASSFVTGHALSADGGMVAGLFLTS
jgi:NAD(P)-dependent dehydrogenase (short-subunit alcohol dehydrogenase family)